MFARRARQPAKRNTSTKKASRARHDHSHSTTVNLHKNSNMSNSFYHLKNKQMIITFADLEGDYEFLKRSLSLYRKIYQEIFPTITLRNEDFTVADEDQKQYICYPDNVICVSTGDLTDKTRSNTGRTDCHNMRLVKLMAHTHQKYNERMISILGNRETTKFRIMKEFDVKFIEDVLIKEIELPREKQNETGVERAAHLVWVDTRKKTFLLYLKETLNIENNSQLLDTFMRLPPNKKIIFYAKWMLANSCGAPDLWNDIATEATINSNDDDAILQFIEQFFTDPTGDYVHYLNYSQMGTQIGNLLFTHSGIHDHSFILPATLFTLLQEDELKTLFNDDYDRIIAEDFPSANNIHQLLLALNAWFAKINALRFTTDPELRKIVNAAIDELIVMGLPPARTNSQSIINLPVTNQEGNYGAPLSPAAHEKLLGSNNPLPVYASYHGHSAGKSPRYAEINNEQKILQRIDGDTCGTRRNNAAVGIAFHQVDNALLIKAQYIDEEAQLTILNWPGRTANGQLCDQNDAVIKETTMPLQSQYSPLLFKDKLTEEHAAHALVQEKQFTL